MFNFFASENSRQGNEYIISDGNFNHIKNVLRMKEGDTFLVSENGISNLCKLKCIFDDAAVAVIIEENYNNTELPVEIYLFQGLPKSDKMELIIQKTVELGVHAVIPTEMSRCVVRLEEKKKKSKVERWQAIAESAAKQSKRNIIPEIKKVMSYKEAMEEAKKLDMILLPYEAEDGMASTADALKSIKNGTKIGIFIGPEGGFDENEVTYAKNAGANIVSLGKRILRTETAAIASVAMCMLYIEANLNIGEE